MTKKNLHIEIFGADNGYQIVCDVPPIFSYENDPTVPNGVRIQQIPRPPCRLIANSDQELIEAITKCVNAIQSAMINND